MKILRFLIPVTFLLVACQAGSEASKVPESDAPSIGMPVPGEEGIDEMVVTEDAGGNGDAVDSPKGSGETGMRTVHMDASNWAFTPNTITLKKGETATLELTGVSGVHGIGIPDLGIDKKFSAGETVSVSIPTDTVGSFSFRCNVPCGSGHKDMTGTIVIEE